MPLANMMLPAMGAKHMPHLKFNALIDNICSYSLLLFITAWILLVLVHVSPFWLQKICTKVHISCIISFYHCQCTDTTSGFVLACLVDIWRVLRINHNLWVLFHMADPRKTLLLQQKFHSQILVCTLWWGIIGLFAMSHTHTIPLLGNDADGKYHFGRR